MKTITTNFASILAQTKQWIHEATAPDSNSSGIPKYSTSKRTAPVILDMELAMIPRLPAKPEDCMDEDFEEALEAIKLAWNGKAPNGKFLWYPRQRELYIQFPPEEVHGF